MTGQERQMDITIVSTYAWRNQIDVLKCKRERENGKILTKCRERDGYDGQDRQLDRSILTICLARGQGQRSWSSNRCTEMPERERQMIRKRQMDRTIILPYAL